MFQGLQGSLCLHIYSLLNAVWLWGWPYSISSWGWRVVRKWEDGEVQWKWILNSRGCGLDTGEVTREFSTSSPYTSQSILRNWGPTWHKDNRAHLAVWDTVTQNIATPSECSLSSNQDGRTEFISGGTQEDSDFRRLEESHTSNNVEIKKDVTLRAEYNAVNRVIPRLLMAAVSAYSC
jgi:hypothetical protein